VEEACQGKLMVGKYPVFVLNLSLPAEAVDVNVHPAKMEVRFSNEDEIYAFVYGAVQQTLQKENLIPRVGLKGKPVPTPVPFPHITGKEDLPRMAEQNTLWENGSLTLSEHTAPPAPDADEPAACSVTRALSSLLDLPAPDAAAPNTVFPNTATPMPPPFSRPGGNLTGRNTRAKEPAAASHPSYAAQTPPAPPEAPSDIPAPLPREGFFQRGQYRIVGQVFHTYWLLEQGGSLFWIDQHAAHERILYEEFLHKGREDGAVPSQQLLQPLVVKLSPTERHVLEENLELLARFGFELDDFGQDTYAVRAVPFVFDKPTDAAFLLEILARLENRTLDEQNIYEAKLMRVASLSCKAAVKANDKLDYAEAKALIEKLVTLENPFTCPHGRPTIVEMTKYELEKKFKRIL